MVGGISAWVPAMDRASMGSGITESPCKTCPKRHMDKDECIGSEGCRIDCRREPVFAVRRDVAITTVSKEPYNCAWPGCPNMIHRGRYCTGPPHNHSTTVSRRKSSGWDESRWYEPISERHSHPVSGPKKKGKK